MITVEEALARVLASAETPLEEERSRLQRLMAGCWRATSWRCAPSRRSPIRRWTATRCARPTRPSPPATLTVIGESAAGRAFEGAVGPGEAVRIFTGAPMPDGADADRHPGGRAARGRAHPALGRRAGRRQSAPGRARLSRRRGADRGRPAAHARATSRWPRRPTMPRSPVRRRARVAILATGDELVAPGGTLGPSQIIASNNFAVAGIVEACGGVAIDLGIARRRRWARSTAAIGSARDARADVLVTLGGASVGDHDLVQKALRRRRHGARLLADRHAARQAADARAARRPCACSACPAIRPRRWSARSCSCARSCAPCTASPTPARIPSQPARLAVDLPANGARQDYMRASLAPRRGRRSRRRPRSRTRIPRWSR